MEQRKKKTTEIILNDMRLRMFPDFETEAKMQTNTPSLPHSGQRIPQSTCHRPIDGPRRLQNEQSAKESPFADSSLFLVHGEAVPEAICILFSFMCAFWVVVMVWFTGFFLAAGI